MLLTLLYLAYFVGSSSSAWTDTLIRKPPTETQGFIFHNYPRFSKVTDFVHRLLHHHKLPTKNLQAQVPDCTFPTPSCDPSSRYRTIDGYCNNLRNPSWGSPGWPFKRVLPPLYDDGVDHPRTIGKLGSSLPSPRTVSKTIHTHDSVATETSHLTSLFTHFGQFLIHDIDLTPLKNGDSELDCCEQDIQFPVRNFYSHPPTTSLSYSFKSRPLPGTCFTIDIPQPDNHFKSTCMNFVRSKIFAPSFKCKSATREQGNAVTSFIDASQVYGSTQAQMTPLREFVGGLLKSDQNSMLPVNASTTCKSSKIPGKHCFGAGDLRVNEQPMLSTFHVVFHRLHNYIASFLSTHDSQLDDEILFQESRKIIGGIMQHIVYNEYLPLLLGNAHMTDFGLKGNLFHRYEPNTDPRIINSFATAAFRFGHSMVPGHLKFGNIKEPLHFMFFCPHKIQDTRNDALNNLLAGSLSEKSQGADVHFSSSLSDNLFLDKTKDRSLDLAAFNIQRGRDHGLPSYNDFREACGLPRVDGTEPEWQKFLSIFGHMDDVDLFSGALAEEHVSGGVVGDTFACIIARQFRDLKYGDRFWYETTDPKTGFTRAQRRAIKKVTMASVLCAVGGVSRTQKSAFSSVSSSNPEVSCDQIDGIDLITWTG